MGDENKITYGLEQVHIAFKGTAQVESIEVTAGCGTDGELTVTVTSAVVTGSPLALIVPVSTESHSTAAKVASAVCNVLNNNDAISAAFFAYNVGAIIYLVAKVVADNDATLAIAFTPGTTGVTVGASTNVTAGATGWGAPQALVGAVGYTPSPEGSEVKTYADNVPWFVLTINNGYKADLEIVNIPLPILAEMLGWYTDANGMIVEISDATPKKFALMGQVQGDQRHRRFVYYDCQAARPSKEEKTQEDTITPSTDKITLDILPINMQVGSETKKVVKGTIELSDTNTTVFNNFFKAVYIPQAAA